MIIYPEITKFIAQANIPFKSKHITSNSASLLCRSLSHSLSGQSHAVLLLPLLEAATWGVMEGLLNFGVNCIRTL